MPSHQSVSIAKNFSCHSWNKDQSQIALCPNNNEICIFNTNGDDEMKKWGKPIHTLTEHGMFVSAIDWHPESNNIVTSGHDRNAYVWKYCDESKKWSPTLVILRINRAATSVRWSPSGDKFAVTSGAKCVPVCHYEESNNWWISKMIKKHKSTVLCLAWSPDNHFIITGSTDFKCRIFSAWVEDVDLDPKDGSNPLSWERTFGNCLVEFDHAKAWVQGVAWSPDSLHVAFVGHGSTTTFVELDSENPKASLDNVQTVYSKDLPNLTCTFMSDESLVTCGFDMNPHLYIKGSKWEFSKKLDPEIQKVATSNKSSASKNRQMFKSMDKHGQKSSKQSAIKTFHKNIISDVAKLSDDVFSTCGVDGRILKWNLKEL